MLILSWAEGLFHQGGDGAGLLHQLLLLLRRQMVNFPQVSHSRHQDQPGILAVFGQQDTAEGRSPSHRVSACRRECNSNMKTSLSTMNRAPEKGVSTLLQRAENLKLRHGPTDKALAQGRIGLQEQLL